MNRLACDEYMIFSRTEVPSPLSLCSSGLGWALERIVGDLTSMLMLAKVTICGDIIKYIGFLQDSSPIFLKNFKMCTFHEIKV